MTVFVEIGQKSINLSHVVHISTEHFNESVTDEVTGETYQRSLELVLQCNFLGTSGMAWQTRLYDAEVPAFLKFWHGEADDTDYTLTRFEGNTIKYRLHLRPEKGE